MARKRLLENNPSSSSSSSSGEEDEELPQEDNAVEDEELPREDNTVDSDSDSETESDNNVSAFEVMPIIPKSAMRSDPDRSGDAKVIAAAADETPKKKRKKLKAEKGKPPVLFKKPDQKSSDLSKNVTNVFAITDVADVEMAEPSDEPSDDPPFHITLALPCKRALQKKSKVNKSGKEKGKVVEEDEKEDPVGDKVVAVSERLKGKKKVTAKWAENEEYPVGDKVVAVSERTKGKMKDAAKGAEKKNILNNKIESLSEGLKGEVVGDKNEEDYLSLIGDGTGVWWEDLSKIESDKAEELKKKWKEMKVEELELLILKKELLKEIAIAVSDAMKASRS